MNQVFKCENGDQFSLNDCMMVSVLYPDAVQKLFEDEGVRYYAKVYITDRQSNSLVCYNIVRKDYDRLVEMRMNEVFKCGNGDILSLNAFISMSELRSEVVQQLLQEEGVTYYAKLYITGVSKKCQLQRNITLEDYTRLSKVYADPIFGSRI